MGGVGSHRLYISSSRTGIKLLIYIYMDGYILVSDDAFLNGCVYVYHKGHFRNNAFISHLYLVFWFLVLIVDRASSAKA